MVNPGCYTGMRLKYMHERLTEFKTKKSDVDREAFILTTIRLFLNRFPVSLGDEDPTEEQLNSVDDSIAPVEQPLPEEGTEEYEKVWRERQDRATKEKKRGDQIRRWLKSHNQQHMGNSERGAIYTAKETSSHKSVLRGRIAGVVKPRRLTTHFFWAQENQDIIKALKEEGNEEGSEDPKKIKKGNRKGKRAAAAASASDVDEDEETSERKKTNGLTSYQALCKSEFEKLDETEQREWKEMADLSFSQKSERYTAITKGQSLTRTPEFRQECLDNLADFVQPVLDVVSEMTGGVCGLWTAAPEPRNGGQPTILTHYAGTTPGPNGLDFGHSERDAFKEKIRPVIKTYIQKCWSVEECQSRAIPQEVTQGAAASKTPIETSASTSAVGKGVPISSQVVTGAGASTTIPDPSVVSSHGSPKIRTHKGTSFAPASVPPSSPAFPLNDDLPTSPAAARTVDTNEMDMDATEHDGGGADKRKHGDEDGGQGPSKKKLKSVSTSAVKGKTTSAKTIGSRTSRAPKPVPKQRGKGSIDTQVTGLKTPAGAKPVPQANATGSLASNAACNSTVPKTSRMAKPVPKEKATGPVASNADPKPPVSKIPPVEKAVPQPKVMASDHSLVSTTNWVAVIPKLQADGPKYVENTLELCAWVEGEKRWERVVQCWFRLDQAAGFQASSKELARLPTAGRPKEVGTWISHARSANFHPQVVLPRFGMEFANWWRGMQPEGREAVEDDFLAFTASATIDWTEVLITGSNGLVNVVGALAWWHKAVYALPKANSSGTGRSGQQRELELRKLNVALDDVGYVLNKLVESLE